jgi:ribonuclease HI
MALTHKKYTVYADGSCIGNPGPGGWGVIVIAPDGSRREFNGYSPATTNNKMELAAAIEGLRATEPGSHVLLRSDSQYLVNTMNLGWKRAKNHDLWKQIDAERDARTVEFEWVRGHATDPLNHRADELAVMGAKGLPIAAESTDGQIIARPMGKRMRRADSSGLQAIEPMLRAAEKIHKCAGCGEQFVALHVGEAFCSHVRCQIKARGA